MSASLERFRLLAPELSALSDTDANKWIALASDRLDGGTAFGTDALDAVVLYAAHAYAVRLPTGSGAAAAAAAGFGPATSQADGNVSRSFAVPAWTSSSAFRAWLARTRFGAELAALTDVQGLTVRGVTFGR